MASLIECVPNFSEGRRQEVLDGIARAIRQIEGVSLLDFSRDESHNRSVATFAGRPEPVVRAAMAAVGRALELIDMEQQTGAHPRIGAVDVIPFVPLGETRMDECVDLASEATRQGLSARMRRIQLRELAAEVGSIASEGLRRLGHRDERGRDETVYLEPTLELISMGISPANLTARRWTGDWNAQIEKLVTGSVLQGDLP